jgi:hopanoid biosynthesis associated protein HpnK
MRRAIINADDFGLCRGVNEGIIKAHREGVLTSTTLMANMPGFEHAVALSRENPRLGVGIHLNLLRGRPVAPPDEVPSLLAPSGLMWGSVYVFLRRLWAGRISPSDIETELRAQVEKVLQAGVPATHADSEKHIHTIPAVFRTVARLLPEYGLRRVRFINEFCLSLQPAQTAKALAISLSCRRMRRRLREHAIMTADRFYGLCGSGRMTVPRLARILERLGEGTAEIMLHPGYMTDELIALERLTGSYYINNRRELELGTLLDPGIREVVARRAIELITFREI